MIQHREPDREKSTIVRSDTRRRVHGRHRGGKAGRLVRCHGRRLAAHMARKPGLLTSGTESGRERLIVGLLTLIALGYGVAVLARITVQYGL